MTDDRVRIPSDDMSDGGHVRYDDVALPFTARTTDVLPWVLGFANCAILVFVLFGVWSKIDPGSARGSGASTLIAIALGGPFSLALLLAALSHFDVAVRHPTLTLSTNGFADERRRTSAPWRTVIAAKPVGTLYLRAILVRLDAPVEMTIPVAIGRFGFLWRRRTSRLMIVTTGLDQPYSVIEKIMLTLVARSTDSARYDGEPR